MTDRNPASICRSEAKRHLNLVQMALYGFAFAQAQAQKRWFPMTVISGRLQIQALVAVAGLK